LSEYDSAFTSTTHERGQSGTLGLFGIFPDWTLPCSLKHFPLVLEKDSRVAGNEIPGNAVLFQAFPHNGSFGLYENGPLGGLL